MRVKDSERGFLIQGEGFWQVTPRTQSSLILSWGDANEYFWGRAGVKYQLANLNYSADRSLHLGVEVTHQGNDEGEADQLGAMFELALPRMQASRQFRAGLSRDLGAAGIRSTGHYFGAGFYRAF